MSIKKNAKKIAGSNYKPYIGQNRARDMFAHYIEEAENGSLESASLVFRYLFPAQKPALTYKIDVDSTSVSTEASSIMEAMYRGLIDVDSAHKMLDALTKKIAIVESLELQERVEKLENHLRNQ